MTMGQFHLTPSVLQSPHSWNDARAFYNWRNAEINWDVVHSKNSRVRFDPEKGSMGPDPFLGQTDLESG